MSGLHIPPFAGGSPEDAESDNRSLGLQSTPTAAGRGGMRSRTGAITIVRGRGAKQGKQTLCFFSNAISHFKRKTETQLKQSKNVQFPFAVDNARSYVFHLL